MKKKFGAVFLVVCAMAIAFGTGYNCGKSQFMGYAADEAFLEKEEMYRVYFSWFDIEKGSHSIVRWSGGELRLLRFQQEVPVGVYEFDGTNLVSITQNSERDVFVLSSVPGP